MLVVVLRFDYDGEAAAAVLRCASRSLRQPLMHHVSAAHTSHGCLRDMA